MSTSTKQAENRPSGAPRVRKRNALTLACVVVLVLLLVGGSLLGLLRGKGGASGIARATATATASPAWTPTEITPPIKSMFYDTFVDNRHNWSLSSANGYFRILVNNTLILANANPNTPLVESVPAGTSLANYVISVDFTINQGDKNDGLGLYLRGDSHLDHDYRVDLNGNNTFDMMKEGLSADQAPQTTSLVSPRHIDGLNSPGKQNTLTIMMVDSAITVIVNDVALATVNDTSYTSGQAALFVRHGNSSSRVTASLSRVEIDYLASPFTSPVPQQ